MKKIIAITGKIGAGKSTLASYLEKKFPVFYVDKIEKKLYRPKNKLWKMINDDFPELMEKNFVNLKRIKQNLINDIDFKTQFQEKVIEILIIEIKKITKNSNNIVFVEIPYINSKKLLKLFDFVIEVKAEKAIRLKRIIKRDDTSEKQALDWINSYVKNISFAKSITIKNNSTIEDLENKIQEALQCIIL